jgi:nucleoid-associated protein EbfC
MPQPNMQQMLKQVQKVQADMARAQEEIAAAQVQASSGGGMVTVTVSGTLEVKSVRIEPAAIDPDDPDLLSDLVMAAVNEALRSAQQLAAERMQRATGGLDLGSLGGLGGLGLPGF